MYQSDQRLPTANTMDAIHWNDVLHFQLVFSWCPPSTRLCIACNCSPCPCHIFGGIIFFQWLLCSQIKLRFNEDSSLHIPQCKLFWNKVWRWFEKVNQFIVKYLMDRTGWIEFDWIEINWKLCLSPAAAAAPAMVAPSAPVIKGRMKCSRTRSSVKSPPSMLLW